MDETEIEIKLEIEKEKGLRVQCPDNWKPIHQLRGN